MGRLMRKDSILAAEIQTYNQQKQELLEQHRGAYVLVKGFRIVGVFEDEHSALIKGVELFGNVPFFVKRIQEAEEDLYFTFNF